MHTTSGWISIICATKKWKSDSVWQPGNCLTTGSNSPCVCAFSAPSIIYDICRYPERITSHSMSSYGHWISVHLWGKVENANRGAMTFSTLCGQWQYKKLPDSLNISTMKLTEEADHKAPWPVRKCAGSFSKTPTVDIQWWFLVFIWRVKICCHSIDWATWSCRPLPSCTQSGSALVWQFCQRMSGGENKAIVDVIHRK